MCFTLWGTSSPDPYTGASSLDPTGESRPQTPYNIPHPFLIFWIRHCLSLSSQLVPIHMSVMELNIVVILNTAFPSLTETLYS